MKRAKITFVVLAGGRGERLWPLVRRNRPKIALSTNGGKSLLQATVERLRAIDSKASWLFVTTQDQAASVRRQLPKSQHKNVLAEPQGRNTAACITLAAVRAATLGLERILVVVPADHWVGDVKAFQRSIETAVKAAASCEALVTVGIRPRHAHPGLGYLVPGRRVPLRGASGVRRLKRFVEKPSAARARRLIDSGACWNSGIFVGSVETFMIRLTEWLPEHVRNLLPLANGGFRPKAASRAYRRLRAVSFDHGVMEHLSDALVVKGNFDWEDLGSWDAWSRRAGSGSTLISVDSRNVTAVSEEPHLIAAIGVENVVIVRTRRATLVCARDQAQAVRRVVKRMERDRHLAGYR